MAFKEIPATIFFKFGEPGTPESIVQGKYLGSRQQRGKKGMQIVYDIEMDNGKLVMISGYTFIERQMARVNPNDVVRISYLGEVDPKSGGNKYKAFKVEVDK